MPILPVGDAEGRLRLEDGFLIKATMLAPDDSAARDEIRLLMNASEAAARAGSGPLDPRIWLIAPGGGARNVEEPLYALTAAALARLLRGPSLEEMFHDALNGGQIAAAMVYRALQLAEHAPGHASVENASRLTERAATWFNREVGTNLPANRTYIFRAWTNFKSVAHLWAACSHLSLDDYEGVPRGALPETLEATELVLSVAAALAEKAGATRHPRSTKPVIDPGELWRAPAALQLPAFTLPPTRPLTNDERKAITSPK